MTRTGYMYLEFELTVHIAGFECVRPEGYVPTARERSISCPSALAYVYYFNNTRLKLS